MKDNRSSCIPKFVILVCMLTILLIGCRPDITDPLESSSTDDSTDNSTDDTTTDNRIWQFFGDSLPSQGVGYNPRISVSDTGEVYVMFHEGSLASPQVVTYLSGESKVKKYSDGFWEDIWLIEHSPDNFSNGQDITVDDNGTIWTMNHNYDSSGFLYRYAYQLDSYNGYSTSRVWDSQSFSKVDLRIVPNHSNNGIFFFEWSSATLFSILNYDPATSAVESETIWPDDALSDPYSIMWIEDIAIDLDGKILLLFYERKSVDGNIEYTPMMKAFDGNTWIEIGSIVEITGRFEDPPPQLFVDIDRDGSCYVVYSDRNSTHLLTVITYDGNAWFFVGEPGLIDDPGCTPGFSGDYDIAVFDDTPYVIFTDGDNFYRPTVVSYQIPS